MSSEILLNLISKYETALEPHGFEIKPFLIGWYNEKVNQDSHLKFSSNTLAFNIISTPQMFEKTFLKFIVNSELQDLENKLDLLDESINKVFHQVNNDLSEEYFQNCGKPLKSVIIRDYEANNVTRQPKVIVCISGHVSGQARYYQRFDIPIDKDPWQVTDRIIGCSFHHIYGGWFAFRGIIVFPELEDSDLKCPEPPDPLRSDVDLIVRLLQEFNFNWRTWAFRDIVNCHDGYSQACKAYLSLPPGEKRSQLVSKWWRWLQDHKNKGSEHGSIDLKDFEGTKLLDWGM